MLYCFPISSSTKLYCLHSALHYLSVCMCVYVCVCVCMCVNVGVGVGVECGVVWCVCVCGEVWCVWCGV